METLQHTKIYGNGVSTLLKQAEINAKFDHNEGTLSIEITKDICLVIRAACINETGALKFYIESSKIAGNYYES